MRIKRNKKAAKIVNLLTKPTAEGGLGYRRPLQIIADGTFFQAAVTNQIAKNYAPQTGFEKTGKVYKVKGSAKNSNERGEDHETDPLTQALVTYLKCSVNVFTTISVMNEMAMGQIFSGSAA